MSKHTPGPWNRNIKPARKYTTIFAGRNTHVARLVTEGLSDEELEANCNLIAAAPEMYELLGAALLELEQDGKCTGLIEDIQLLFKRIQGESK